MLNFGLKYFISFSTATVYGVPERIPISENAELKLINPYGESKATVEKILKDLKLYRNRF